MEDLKKIIERIKNKRRKKAQTLLNLSLNT